MLDKLRRFLTSGTARSGISFAASGLSFAVANVILANELTVEGYGMFALLVAIIMLASFVGMLGADGVINRHQIAPDGRLFARIGLSATAVAVTIGFFAMKTYAIPPVLVAMLIPTIIAFAVARFCGAYLQSRLHLTASLFLFNSLNYLLLGVALVCVIWQIHDIKLPFFYVTVSQCVIAVFAVVLVRHYFKSTKSDYVYSWRESLAYLFMASASEMLVQLERLVTPRILGLEELAILGVLLAIIGPPFRLLYLTLGYDLLPVLRQSRHNAERVSLLFKHSLIAIGLIIPLWAVIWFGAPLVQRAFLTEAYALSNDLILAALVAGTVKSFSGIAQASVTALASVRAMEIVGVIGWLSVGLGILAAWYGARYGLAGVVYGVGFGWLVRLVASSFIVAGQLGELDRESRAEVRGRTLPEGSTPD